LNGSESIFGWLISASWAALVGYWCVSAAGAIRTSGTRWIWWREITLRLGFFASVLLLVQIEAAAGFLPLAGSSFLNTSWPLGLSGFLLSVLGVGLAIGARVSLGAVWAVRAPSQLITNGPYATVRHPLYGGLLLAMLGSAMGQSVLWVLPLIVYGPGFVASARREEQVLLEQFPDQYRDYMRHTKLFIPFLY
jgi:protein-S-isoprenylcysteine O-methyltransferase Ste14